MTCRLTPIEADRLIDKAVPLGEPVVIPSIAGPHGVAYLDSPTAAQAAKDTAHDLGVDDPKRVRALRNALAEYDDGNPGRAIRMLGDMGFAVTAEAFIVFDAIPAAITNRKAHHTGDDSPAKP